MDGIGPHQIKTDANDAYDGCAPVVQGDATRWHPVVAAGSPDYTIVDGRPYGTKVAEWSSSQAVVFGCKRAFNDFAGQYFFADPYYGFFWGGGDTDAYDDSDSVNVFLWDVGEMAIRGMLRVYNGPLNLMSEAVMWDPDQREYGPLKGLGDAQIEGSAPNVVGVKGYTTAQRDTLITDITATGDHYMVFDTDLGKPIWSDGSGGWVDATGTTV